MNICKGTKIVRNVWNKRVIHIEQNSNKVEPGYNLGLYDTSFIASDILL
jgi:hypothetical protein